MHTFFYDSSLIGLVVRKLFLQIFIVLIKNKAAYTTSNQGLEFPANIYLFKVNQEVNQEWVEEIDYELLFQHYHQRFWFIHTEFSK